jgi:hypothetical protein
MAKAWAVCAASSAALAAALRVFEFLTGRCQFTGEGIASSALLVDCLSLLGDRGLGDLQGFFSFSTRIGHHRNASRQSFDFLLDRCQLAGKNFTSLALSLAHLLVLDGQSLGRLHCTVRSFGG